MNKEAINGYGVVLLRFVTPLLVAFTTYIISGLKGDIKEVRAEARANFDKLEKVAQTNFDGLNKQFSNHLSHHQSFDKEICERLASMEARIKR